MNLKKLTPAELIKLEKQLQQIKKSKLNEIKKQKELEKAEEKKKIESNPSFIKLKKEYQNLSNEALEKASETSESFDIVIRASARVDISDGFAVHYDPAHVRVSFHCVNQQCIPSSFKGLVDEILYQCEDFYLDSNEQEFDFVDGFKESSKNAKTINRKVKSFINKVEKSDFTSEPAYAKIRYLRNGVD